MLKPNLNITTEELPALIPQMNAKILSIASIYLDNIKYGFKTKVNYYLYQDLVMYKSILLDIMYCSDTMCDVNIPKTVSKIKKLIHSIC